jgi:hypothetical protein
MLTAVPLLVATPVGAAGTISYGEWNPNWQERDSVNDSVIIARETDMGHRLNLIHWYAAAHEGYADYDHVMVDNALRLGSIPFVSWGIPIGFSDTAKLDDWANGIKAKAPHQVYIRLFWEFNDPPTGTNSDWGVCQSSHTPTQLVKSWRSIVDRFRADGATNVKWVWNADGTMGSQMYGNRCGSVGAAYPGDDYVDFRGFDDYEYDTRAQYNALNAQTRSSRPMLLGEVGASDRDAQNGARWVNNLSKLLENGSLPQIQAVVYFNDGSSAFRSNPNIHAAVKTMLTRAQTPAARSC